MRANSNRAILPKAPANGNRLVEARLTRQSEVRGHIDSLPTLCYPHWARPAIKGKRLCNNRPVTRVFLMKTCPSLIEPNSNVYALWSCRAAWGLVCIALLLWSPLGASAKSKHHRAPLPEPELKILDLKVSPIPYIVSSGPLQFSALVQLPKDLNGANLLEVSSFITSPSKNSLRFLTTRTTLEPHDGSTGSTTPQVSLLLTWDGLDHNKIPSGAGLYNFEVRAKLLANGEKGPRTQMVAWPKRGTVEVR